MIQGLRLLIALGLVVGGGTLLARRRAQDDPAGSSVALAALARLEARRLASHPVLVVVIAVVLAMYELVYALAGGGVTTVGGEDNFFLLVPAYLGGIALIVATDRNASRSRRGGADELLASLPTSSATRTGAHLLSGLGPLPIVLAGVLSQPLLDPFHFRGVSPVPIRIDPAVLSLGALLVLGSVVVGVLSSRWLAVPFASVVLAVAVVYLNNTMQHRHPRQRFLRAAPEIDFLNRFDLIPRAWHLGMVAGLVVLGAGVALGRHGWLRLPAGLALAGALAVAVGGYEASRPPTAERVALRVDELVNPAAHQRCAERDSVRVCVFSAFTTWQGMWLDAAARVRSAAPAGAGTDRLDVVQRPYYALRGELLPDITARLDPRAAWHDDGAVHPGMDVSLYQPVLEVGLQSGAIMTGLPPVVVADRPRACNASGQARLAVTYWLAGQADTGNADRLRVLATRERPTPFENDEDDGAVIGGAGFGGSQSDLAAAAALLELSDAGVKAVVADRWATWIDPATPVADLLAAAGVPALRGTTGFSFPGSGGRCA